MNISGFPPGGPSGPNAQQHSTQNQLIKRHLSTRGFQRVLDGLGLSAKDIAGLVKEEGVHAKALKHLQDMRFIEITQEKAEIIKALGLGNVELAIVLQSEEEITRIRKRLKELREALIDKAMMQRLLSALGMKAGLDILIYLDETGGLVLIQAAMKEVLASMDDEE